VIKKMKTEKDLKRLASIFKHAIERGYLDWDNP
jgi:hypothetical protein